MLPLHFSPARCFCVHKINDTIYDRKLAKRTGKCAMISRQVERARQNDPLGGCLIVNRLAVHLQNTGRATDPSSPNSRCSEAERIEDEKYLHPMRRSEMAAELRRAPCADSKRTLETWIARVIAHSVEPTKLPDRARLRLRHSKQ